MRGRGRHRRRARASSRLGAGILALLAVGGVGAGTWAVLARDAADLSLGVAAEGEPLSAGDALTLVFVVANAGPSTAVAVEVTIPFPGSALLGQASAPGGACSSGPPVVCPAGDLPSGSEATLRVVLDLVAEGTVEIAGTASSRTGDPREVNDSATFRAAVAGPSCTQVGTPEDDRLAGTPDGDVLCGRGGDDTLVAGPGDDVLAGGPGDDTATYASVAGPVTFDLAAGTVAGAGADSIRGIERVVGSPFDDEIRAAGLDVSVDGGPGRDLLDLSGAGRPVDLDLGEDGGPVAGVEDVVGTPFDDTLAGDDGPNRLDGGPGDDVLAGRGADDQLSGGDGRDRVDLSGARGGVVVDLAAGTAEGEGRDALDGIEDASGGPGPDVLRGDDGANVLDGAGGPDVLLGRGGDDLLSGGDGPDTASGGPGDDAIAGGRGSDACVQGEPSGRVPLDGCELVAYAELEDVVLVQPSSGVIGIGFHESLFATSVPLRPLGTLRMSDSAAFVPVEETDGPEYVVMSSRARANGPTTSADIVVPSRSPVLSPVTGTVVLVRPYRLYCQYADNQVLIRPAGREDLLVMVLHMSDPAVGQGDRVVGGVTPLGTSWGNDAPDSQENEYWPDQHPHVHVEVEAAEAVGVPGCL